MMIRAAALWALALLGVWTLVQSIPITEEIIRQTGLDARTLRLASLANNAVLIALAVAIGRFAAPRVGLSSLIAKGDERIGVRALGLPIYAIIGFCLGAALAAGDGFMLRSVDALAPMAQPSKGGLFSTGLSLEVRLLYGGVTEEVLLRWGLMSLLAWLIFLPTRSRSLALASGGALAAVLFGVGHLPALYQGFDAVNEAMVARVIALNAVLGLFYAWFYARHSLEAAMIAHAATHVGMLAAVGMLSL